MKFFFKGLKLTMVKVKGVKDEAVGISTDKANGFFLKIIGDLIFRVKTRLAPVDKVCCDVFEREGGCWMIHG